MYTVGPSFLSIKSGTGSRTPTNTRIRRCSSPWYKRVQYLHITYAHPPIYFMYFYNIKKIFFINFIYSLLCWVFVAPHRLSLVALSGGFSCCRAQALGHTGWEVAAYRFSSCGSRAQLTQDTWNLPRPWIKPVSPALAGGFLTPGPQGSPFI